MLGPICYILTVRLAFNLIWMGAAMFAMLHLLGR